MDIVKVIPAKNMENVGIHLYSLYDDNIFSIPIIIRFIEYFTEYIVNCFQYGNSEFVYKIKDI